MIGKLLGSFDIPTVYLIDDLNLKCAKRKLIGLLKNLIATNAIVTEPNTCIGVIEQKAVDSHNRYLKTLAFPFNCIPTFVRENELTANFGKIAINTSKMPEH